MDKCKHGTDKSAPQDLSKVYKLDVSLFGSNHVPGSKKVCFWQNRLESCKPDILMSQVSNCMQTFLARDKELDVTYEMSFKVTKKSAPCRRAKIQK